MKAKRNPMISVVIPLYNKLDHILRTVDSVLAQTFTDYELIIVDDGSTDGSPNLIEKHRGEQINLIRQVNEGVSRARNQGVKAAKGEIIAFIDADDTWEPHFLAEIANMYTAFPEAHCYATCYQFILGNGLYHNPKIRFTKRMHRSGLLDNYFEVSARGDLPFMMSSFCIKRNFFNQLHGFPEGVTMGEDQDLFVRAALNGHIAYSPSVLSFYHLDSSNRACQRIVPQEECSFSKYVYEQTKNEALSPNMRENMNKYSASHLLHVASLNIRLGRLAIAKRLLNDERCQSQPMKYMWWMANYWFNKLTVGTSKLTWV